MKIYFLAYIILQLYLQLIFVCENESCLGQCNFRMCGSDLLPAVFLRYLVNIN